MGRPGYVRVRRRRPAAVLWSCSVLISALALYLLTLTAGSSPAVSAAGLPQTVVFPELAAHFIRFGLYENADMARVEAARYTSRGAAGYIYASNGYSVLGAIYASADEAERVSDRLYAQEGIPSAVLTLSAKEVRLSLATTDAEVSAMSAADSCLRGAADQLMELAYSLDRGELTAEQGRTRLAVISGDLVTAESELLPFSKVGGSVAESLYALIHGFADQTRALTGELSLSALALSGQVKYLSIDLRVSQIQLLRELYASTV